MTAVVLLAFIFLTSAVAAAVYFRVARPNDVSIGMVSVDRDTDTVDDGGDESVDDGGDGAEGDGRGDAQAVVTTVAKTDTSVPAETTSSLNPTSATSAPPPTGTPLEGELRDGRVSLTGALPDLAIGEQFVTLIEGFVGDGNVDPFFTLNPGSPVPNSFTLRVVDNILFEPGGETVNPRFLPFLDQIVQFMTLDPNITLVVEGHTDSTGDGVENLALSQRRAEAVRQYVSAEGINEFRLEARGRGSSEPVAKDDTPEGRERNRRIEFELVGVRVQGS